MTISIHIEAHPDRGDMGEQVERAMSALGFYRTTATAAGTLESAVADRVSPGADPQSGGIDRGEPAWRSRDQPHMTEGKLATGPEHTGTLAATLDTRPIGAPAEGNKRRNSAEKAEDDALEALAAEKGVPLDQLNAAIAKAGRGEARRQLETLDRADKQVAETPAISTGENRVGPEDDPEAEVQDAADEAAETEKAGLEPIDILRRLVGEYQKRHGMPAAVKLCQEGGLIGRAIHELDDAGIEAAIVAMQQMDEAPGVAEAETQSVQLAPKTRTDLINAMVAYGKKFDGTTDQTKMKFTMEDCPRIFIDLFGAGVTKLSQVPEDGYARAVAAIEHAIATDPYGRAK